MNKYNFTFNMNDDNIVTAIAGSITEHSTVLEFGPDHGRLTKYLKESKDCIVDIVEINSESGAEASRYAREALIGPENGNIDTFKWLEAFKNQKYDYIIFADVLEHLRYPERVIASTYDILKNDGCVLISIPNITHNAILINLYNDMFNYTNTGLLDDSHIHFWGLTNFYKMANELNYCITNIRPFYLDTDKTEQAKYFPQNVKEIESMFKNRPHGNVYQYFIQLHKKGVDIREIDLNSLSKRSFPMAVYLDIGYGFTESNKTSDTISSGEEFIKEIKLNTDIENFRIDPVEGVYSKVFIETMCDDCSVAFSSNNSTGRDNSGYYEFLTEDPWFVFNGPFKKGQSLKIKLIMFDVPIWESVKLLNQRQLFLQTKFDEAQVRISESQMLTDRLNETMGAKDSEMSALRTALNARNFEISALRRTLGAKDGEISALKETMDAKKGEMNALWEALNARDGETASLKAALSLKTTEVNALREALDARDVEVATLNDTLIDKCSEVKILNKAIDEKVVEASEAWSQLDTMREQLGNTSSAIEQISAAYDGVINSSCWKLTKPVRVGFDGMKHILRPILSKGKSITTKLRVAIRYAKHFGLKAATKKVKSKIYVHKKIKSKPVIPINFDLLNQNSEIADTGKSVSIVIPTKNGGEDFEILLKNLKNQKGFDEIEIVVVDSGSTDNTIEISKKYGAKIIEIKPEEFSHSYSRNLGSQNATKEYLCIMTQDALPTSEFWLYHLYMIMNNNPGVMAVSCSEYSRADSDLYHRVFAWNHYKYLGALNADTIMSKPESNDPIIIRQNSQLSDITCFIRRETMLKYKYRGNFAEDLDLGMRLISDGYRLAFLGNEVSIHSHNRGSYYYLKRRFVELVTLKNIFPDQQILDYRYEQVIKETVFLYYYVSKTFENWRSIDENYTFAIFRDKFLNQYREIRKHTYPIESMLKKLNEHSGVDKQTGQFLTECTNKYKEILNRYDEQYNGIMIDAMEGYLNVVFDYMAECYEVVDNEIITEFEECVFKVLTSVIGTFLAYSYLSNEEDKKKYIDFYNNIREGV